MHDGSDLCVWRPEHKNIIVIRQPYPEIIGIKPGIEGLVFCSRPRFFAGCFCTRIADLEEAGTGVSIASCDDEKEVVLQSTLPVVL